MKEPYRAKQSKSISAYPCGFIFWLITIKQPIEKYEYRNSYSLLPFNLKLRKNKNKLLNGQVLQKRNVASSRVLLWCFFLNAAEALNSEQKMKTLLKNINKFSKLF